MDPPSFIYIVGGLVLSVDPLVAVRIFAHLRTRIQPQVRRFLLLSVWPLAVLERGHAVWEPERAGLQFSPCLVCVFTCFVGSSVLG